MKITLSFYYSTTALQKNRTKVQFLLFDVGLKSNKKQFIEHIFFSNLINFNINRNKNEFYVEKYFIFLLIIVSLKTARNACCHVCFIFKLKLNSQSSMFKFSRFNRRKANQLKRNWNQRFNHEALSIFSAMQFIFHEFYI